MEDDLEPEEVAFPRLRATSPARGRSALDPGRERRSAVGPPRRTLRAGTTSPRSSGGTRASGSREARDPRRRHGRSLECRETTVFQFRPVPGIPRARSMRAAVSFDRPIPSG